MSERGPQRIKRPYMSRPSGKLKTLPRMPFGKYRGILLGVMTTKYLEWLLGQDIGEGIKEPLKSQIIQELKSRGETSTCPDCGRLSVKKESERIDER